jgi:2'-5' RNA ligase
MRLFVAVDLPEEIKHQVNTVLHDLATMARKQQAEIKWVKLEQLHFTLKFLGECADEQLPSLTQALEAAVQGITPYPIEIGGLGTFPEQGFLRILWLGLREGDAAMHNLAVRVEAACTPLGFAPEERPFSAHLTLGRVKSCKHPDRIRAFLETSSEQTLGQVTVDAITLMRSVLSSSGPTYTVLKTFPLQ